MKKDKNKYNQTIEKGFKLIKESNNQSCMIYLIIWLSSVPVWKRGHTLDGITCSIKYTDTTNTYSYMT